MSYITFLGRHDRVSYDLNQVSVVANMAIHSIKMLMLIIFANAKYMCMHIFIYSGRPINKDNITTVFLVTFLSRSCHIVQKNR